MNNTNESIKLNDLLELFSSILNTSDIIYSKLISQIISSIVQERLSRQMSQKEFARIIHISERKLKRLEGGNYNISLKELCKIVSYLNKDIQIKII